MAIGPRIHPATSEPAASVEKALLKYMLNAVKLSVVMLWFAKRGAAETEAGFEPEVDGIRGSSSRHRRGC